MTSRLGTAGLVVPLLLAALAGCVGSDDAGNTAGTSGDGLAREGLDPSTVVDGADGLLDETDEGPDPNVAATWTHGDWWTYDISYDLGFGPLLAGETTVVLHDTSTGYKVAAADRGAAMVDQHFDTFFVGELTAELNPRIAGNELTMFDFPLEDGKSWTMQIETFNGTQQFTVTAEAIADAGDPAGASPGYRITGQSDAGVGIEYVYSPLSGWVTSYTQTEFGIDGEPIPTLEMTLRESGSNYEGTFVILEMDDLYFRGVLLPDPTTLVPPLDTVTVPDGYAFVQRVAGIFTFAFPPLPAAAVQRIDLVGPASEHDSVQVLGTGQAFEVYMDEPASAGDWHVAYTGTGASFGLVGFFGFKETVVEFTQASHENHG